MSKQFTGVGVSAGRVIGHVRRMPEPILAPADGAPLPQGVSPEEETQRLAEASKAVATGLKERAALATGDAQAVLKATALMASDRSLIKSATKLVAGGTCAESAIWEAADAVATQLTALGGYMAERAGDVLDVRARIVAELRGVPAPGIPDSDQPFILAAVDLAPADTATLDPAKVLALVTSDGGPQSHTAIIARSLGLPAIVAAPDTTELADGDYVFVDGIDGLVITDPSAAEEHLAATYANREVLPDFTGTGELSDGYRVPLLSNVGSGEDAQLAAAAGAEGVGLLRTEFCFLGKEKEPTHEEQVSAYGAVFAAFGGKKVVVRTLDAGADKPLPFLTDSSEPNPALGVRGYRTDLSSPGVLERQLKAIAQATSEHDADVWVMAPMISTPAEAEDFAKMARAAGLATAGTMIEVPSAAVLAGQILQRCDFVSIGTNDLTQYTMAADRQLGTLAELNDPWQPAVLHMVAATTAGAQSAGGKPVGVCGEAAADPALAVVLVGLGVTTLSMNKRALSPVSAVLRTVDFAKAQRLAKMALDAPSAELARSAVRAELSELDRFGL
ncbi:phosphoenolpyruvate--protein phosphotransferase [Glutamicibacter halophytocola]|uniref:Phosphoenolpyruvate-protein phosphotransferase n=1 Tax=Glutamicibacter halophytocola TaxID=1933880 RepID=A0A5B8ILK7_9MICC|nr:phosphoenolpyruvate--protein phosphotransferase [Glutamicibacter halophytocola]NQD41027.1 phosphoenolpyruvate--protein phosphotransferase [Glutamicibacter halophytocola]QDY67162.1 phosphoenolpyruvate--protein phosphotransferase [Glutamicibacter halophytocola]UUX59329.1 phosphoenolpyruvate--protein phosphotransferase [Glutamicibacter halophytocola]